MPRREIGNFARNANAHPTDRSRPRDRALHRCCRRVSAPARRVRQVLPGTCRGRQGAQAASGGLQRCQGQHAPLQAGAQGALRGLRVLVLPLREDHRVAATQARALPQVR